ncbi:MAG: hypothetical protein AAFY72_12115 [Cyanobacteria bacterium J06649_4]
MPLREFISLCFLMLFKPRFESSAVATTSEIDALITQIEIERDPIAIFVNGMRFCAKARKEKDSCGDA